MKKKIVLVCLAAKGDGTKLKPFIVFPGAKRESKALNDEFKTKCVLASSINGWKNEELTVSWVKGVLGCNVLDSVKQELNRANTDPACLFVCYLFEQVEVLAAI